MTAQTILPANSVVDTGYNVANSLMFNIGDSAYLTRAAATPTSAQIGTMSLWVKRGTLTSTQYLMSWEENSNTYSRLYFNDADRLAFKSFDGGNNYGELITSRKFRDPSAWYHIVCAIDTTDGTAADRIIFYVNGVREASFDTQSQPAVNRNLKIGEAAVFVGKGASSYFNGYIAENYFIDGTKYAASNFGESDEDSGIWKPIDASDLTFGDNGFYLDFEDSSALGTDAVGSNNLTPNNLAATDQSTDTCTNNFITMNPLDNYFPDFTFSNGNTTITSGGNYSYPQATIHLNKGKWYWEVKPVSKASGGNEYMVGIQGRSSTAINQPAQANVGITYYGVDGDTYGFGGGATDYGDAYAANDIIGVALDIDNLKLYFSKNGTFQNSGDPTSGATGTGALSITAIGSVPQGGYSPVAGFYDSPEAVLSFNFGSPYYSISSGNADGNGYGNFEHAVPSGYFSLNTKNLAEYG